MEGSLECCDAFAYFIPICLSTISNTLLRSDYRRLGLCRYDYGYAVSNRSSNELLYSLRRWERRTCN